MTGQSDAAREASRRSNGQFGEQPKGDPGDGVLVMGEPRHLSTVQDWCDDDQIDFARDTLGPDATDTEVQQLAAERAQVMYDEMIEQLLDQPDQDAANRQLATLVDGSKAIVHALDDLGRSLYDPSPTGVFVTGDELAGWLADSQTDPVLADMAGWGDNSRYWQVIGVAKDTLISELAGRRILAGPHGGSDYVIAARSNGDGIELRRYTPHA